MGDAEARYQALLFWLLIPLLKLILIQSVRFTALWIIAIPPYGWIWYTVPPFT